jgi:hypothetical protein
VFFSIKDEPWLKISRTIKKGLKKPSEVLKKTQKSTENSNKPPELVRDIFTFSLSFFLFLWVFLIRDEPCVKKLQGEQKTIKKSLRSIKKPQKTAANRKKLPELIRDAIIFSISLFYFCEVF